MPMGGTPIARKARPNEHEFRWLWYISKIIWRAGSIRIRPVSVYLPCAATFVGYELIEQRPLNELLLEPVPDAAGSMGGLPPSENRKRQGRYGEPCQSGSGAGVFLARWVGIQERRDCH
jgi:hypothetical protein